MHLGYGLFTAQHHPDDTRSDVEIYREIVDLAVEAERIGLESVWTSEHHFVDDGYMPSQLPVLAAIAARTERIALGTGVLLAPMFDPLHLAEDAATVDVLSNGRLILGLGIGWREEEFVGLGGAEGHKGRRLEAIIEVLRQAWGDDLVRGDSHGIYRYPEPGFNVTPKPATVRRTADLDRGRRAGRGRACRSDRQRLHLQRSDRGQDGRASRPGPPGRGGRRPGSRHGDHRRPPADLRLARRRPVGHDP